MGLVLLAAGGMLALVFILQALVRTRRRSERRTLLDTLLAAGIVLLALAGLLVDNLEAVLLDSAESWGLILAAGLIVASVVLLFMERSRHQRLRQSRGVFGLGAGLLVGLAALAIPYAVLYIDTAAAPPPLPTPLNQPPIDDQEAADDARFNQFFDMLMQIIAEETGLPVTEVVQQISVEQRSVADLAASQNGDLETIIQRMMVLMNEQVDILLNVGRITRAEATGALLLIPNVVRMGVANDLNSLLQLFGRNNPVTPVPAEATEQAETP